MEMGFQKKKKKYFFLEMKNNDFWYTWRYIWATLWGRWKPGKAS